MNTERTQNGKQERLKVVISQLGISDAAFARSLDDYSRANLSQILKGNRNAPDSLLRKIARTYGIRYNWLLTGEGQMMMDEPINDNTTDNKEDEGSIPLIPVYAMAGYLTNGFDSVMPYDCERFIVPAFQGADFLIRVQGDSMEPRYMSGDIVACKRVPLDRLWFQWGKAYIIDTTQGALVKRIEPSDRDGFISIHSENTRYKPFDLPTTDINAVALIIGTIRVE